MATRESKSILKSSIVYADDPDKVDIKSIHGCRTLARQHPDTGSLRIFDTEYEDGTRQWSYENDIDPCYVMDWLDEHVDMAKKCPIKDFDRYDAKERKTSDGKIKANNIFIQSIVHNVDNIVELNPGLQFNILILDGEDFNTAWRIINGVPIEKVDQIIVPNPFSSHLMRQAYCGHRGDPLIQKVGLYAQVLSKVLKNDAKTGMCYGAMWLDYLGCWSGNKSDKIFPEKDLNLIFAEDLLLTGGILAITVFRARTCSESANEIFLDVPKIAKKNGYSVVSLCGKDYSYPCSKPKLSSRFDYDRMRLIVYRVYRNRPLVGGDDFDEEDDDPHAVDEEED